MDSASSSSAARNGGNADCRRPDLAHRLSAGEEFQGSFAEELSAHAGTCSSCSMRLSLVRQAERWLADQASSNRAAPASSTPCPSAEDLFDFGHGPGAQALSHGTERRLEAHLVECEECRRLVATLASRPPAPVFDSMAPSEPPERTRARPLEFAGPRKSRQLLRWLPFAAAAAVILGAFYLWSERRGRVDASELVAKAEIRYPHFPRLRGDSANPLRLPAGKVLGSSSVGGTGTWQTLRFEIAPQSGVDGYAIVVSRAGTGAFGASTELGRFTATEPSCELPSDIAQRLTPGKYTWEASALIAGFEKPLGVARDFTVVYDPKIGEQVANAAQLPDAQSHTTILRILVDREFVADAVAYAHGLPQSRERDEFLAQIPGR